MQIAFYVISISSSGADDFLVGPVSLAKYAFLFSCWTHTIPSKAAVRRAW